jgi:type VI secretion system protein ImpA
MAIDIESLLSEVSAEAPCGKNLENDLSFQELKAMMRTKKRGGVVADVEEAEEEPNWRKVCEKSSELLKSSKNLQIAMYLTISLLKLEGITGLRDGLSLIRGLLERFWDNLYPQLDADDENDPFERINILEAMSPASDSEYDTMKFKQRLAEVSLCHSVRKIGNFSLRDIQIANGEIKISDDERAKASDISLINAAFQDTSTDDLLSTSKTIQECIDNIIAIVGVFSKRATKGEIPDLSSFRAVLEDIKKHIQAYLAKRGQGAPVEESTVSTGSNKEKGARPLSGEIRSAQEAVLALDKICQYFDRQEPSSPVPLLLRRAKRLISKSFLEVIKDFCPNGLSQVEQISGISSADQSDE